MWVLLWIPRMTLGKIFRPVNVWFDTIAADVECLVKLYEDSRK